MKKIDCHYSLENRSNTVKMSVEVYLEDLLPFCKPRLTKEALKKRLNEDYDFKLSLAKAYALKHKLGNGTTMKIGGDTYRNENLYFWDAQNEEIVEPFTEIDDYGSVPPRFVVGDGYFNPNEWVDEVEHNTYVFPARPLINEMKAFAEKNPLKKKMNVTIYGVKYAVSYDPVEMKDKWDSCIIEACECGYNLLEVLPGDPSWRNTIVDDSPSSTAPSTAPLTPADAAPSSPGASAAPSAAPLTPAPAPLTPAPLTPSAALTLKEEPKLDSVVTAVLESFKQRAAAGQQKYGTTLDRTDLNTLDWIQHTQEELMDATLYLEKLKREFSHITRPSQ